MVELFESGDLALDVTEELLAELGVLGGLETVDFYGHVDVVLEVVCLVYLTKATTPKQLKRQVPILYYIPPEPRHRTRLLLIRQSQPLLILVDHHLQPPHLILAL